MSVNRAAQHANNKDHWETPRPVFIEIADAFGGFDLDVAASDANHLCDRYFTAEINALAQEWTVKKKWWCNPPFSLKDEFLAKAVEELAKGNEGVMLLPSSQEAEWFRKYITHPKRPRVTWPGRVQFLLDGKRQMRIDKTGKEVMSGNVGGSVIIAFTNDIASLPSGLHGEPWVR
jgi:phage N-6-adenine-methyltransferase